MTNPNQNQAEDRKNSRKVASIATVTHREIGEINREKMDAAYNSANALGAIGKHFGTSQYRAENGCLMYDLSIDHPYLAREVMGSYEQLIRSGSISRITVSEFEVLDDRFLNTLEIPFVTRNKGDTAK
jgi:hypothetical protein